MNLDKTIEKRHSVRKFKTKKPDWRKILLALEAATKAPTAGNIPTVKFVLVDDKEKIQELAQAAMQDFIATAHYVVVVCSDPKQCLRSYGNVAKTYCKQQAGAAIEHILLKLIDLGLATSWVGAFSEDTVKRILRIPVESNVEALLPVGFELGKLKQKSKQKLDRCLYFNTWKNKYMKEIRKPEAR